MMDAARSGSAHPVPPIPQALGKAARRVAELGDGINRGGAAAAAAVEALDFQEGDDLVEVRVRSLQRHRDSGVLSADAEHLGTIPCGADSR
jgi:hypothetical protein